MAVTLKMTRNVQVKLGKRAEVTSFIPDHPSGVFGLTRKGESFILLLHKRQTMIENENVIIKNESNNKK